MIPLSPKQIYLHPDFEEPLPRIGSQECEDKTSLEAVKYRTMDNFAWLEAIAIEENGRVTESAIKLFAGLTVHATYILMELERRKPDVVKRVAESCNIWPSLVFGHLRWTKVPKIEMKKRAEWLEVGKACDDPINYFEVESRESFVKYLACHLAEIISLCVDIQKPVSYIRKMVQRSDVQFCIKNGKKDLITFKKCLHSQLTQVSIDLDVQNPFPNAEAFLKRFKAIASLPDFNTNTASLWYETAKEIVLAYTETPEKVQVLAKLGEHRKDKYENRTGRKSGKSRDSNIRTRIFERLKSAFRVIAKKESLERT